MMNSSGLSRVVAIVLAFVVAAACHRKAPPMIALPAPMHRFKNEDTEFMILVYDNPRTVGNLYARDSEGGTLSLEERKLPEELKGTHKLVIHNKMRLVCAVRLRDGRLVLPVVEVRRPSRFDRFGGVKYATGPEVVAGWTAYGEWGFELPKGPDVKDAFLLVNAEDEESGWRLAPVKELGEPKNGMLHLEDVLALRKVEEPEFTALIEKYEEARKNGTWRKLGIGTP